MGRIFVVELEGRSYRCKFCGTHLALPDQLVSKSFHCRRGKAYLFNNVVNITVGAPEERSMFSGLHIVADIFCCCCGGIIGWKYEAAHESNQKYKEGKFVLESCCWFVSPRNYLISLENIIMEKEDTKLMKLEIMDKDDYPEELKEQGAAALLLSCLPYTRFSYETALTLEKLKSDILGGGKRNQNSSSSRKRPRVSQTQNLGAVVSRNHFNDQQDEYNSNAAARNLPRKPPTRRLEETLKLIDNYEPHEVPSIPGLNGIIGKCSKPFEKQLTESDLRDDQSRLSINKADAQKYLYPLLNADENLAEGISVTTYDPNGKEFEMVFKIWVSKIHVLIGGWKAFFHEHRLRKDQDFVTLWMFRRLDTKKLCFVITWRSLPGVTTPIKRERVRMN